VTVRTGWGMDVHRFGGDGPTLLAGVTVDESRGVIATSDGDVAAHALADALLGAAALGDVGTHFPSDDDRWRDADSMTLLATVAALVRAFGWDFDAVDVTVIAEKVRVAPHREAIRAALATTLGIGVDAVSVKATTTDGLGFLGADEGIAATALAVISR